MSRPSTAVEEQSARSGTVDDAFAIGVDAGVFEALSEAVAVPVRAVCFWAAVALPFLYVPLLFGGLKGSEDVVFVGLLAANAVALFAGHAHRR
ncbi:hypothetical protein [Halegenticoccus tardaugens]|uniref:hypothetical protein n=1 Tax=Halegenticoccus tardaugens TaxID=2071624 RepID=UPI00100B9C31|nr:hypothetical protein [Halegenticoccus tardaugens]